MNCPDCGGETAAFAIPTDLREHTDDEPAAALCTYCLSLHSVSINDADSNPDFAAVSDTFPTGEGAVAMALVVGFLDSLALHRTAVEALLEHAERRGVDPLLVLDRLATDPELDPKADLETRRQQVTQLRG